jgi:hypothetical protein
MQTALHDVPDELPGVRVVPDVHKGLPSGAPRLGPCDCPRGWHLALVRL